MSKHQIEKLDLPGKMVSHNSNNGRSETFVIERPLHHHQLPRARLVSPWLPELTAKQPFLPRRPFKTDGRKPDFGFLNLFSRDAAPLALPDFLGDKECSHIDLS